MKYLFIAEKPSLMQDVKSCYKKHTSEIQTRVGDIDFIALAGHVCCNYEPDDYDVWADVKWQDIQYPMISTVWGVKPIDDARKKKTIAEIKKKIPNYDGIIVGTDSDVEGYGIYHLLETYLHLENIPTLRFIEHSLTDKEILTSLLSMTDFHKDPIHVKFTQSFLVRSRADWLFGYNPTRMMTNKQRQLMRIGRVKAPTIKLVYDNSIAIENFKVRKYFSLVASYGSFDATLVDDKKNPVQFDSIAQIPGFPLEGIVESKTTKCTEEHAPQLFDLTAAQAEAGRTFKLKPDRTLEIIQSLYEKHKVISYPRTQCRYVSSEKAKEFPMMLSHMSVFPNLAPIAKSLNSDIISSISKDTRVVNNAEVQKESHDALLPTSNRPDLSKMTDEERKVCHMIFKRLLAQFMNKLVEDRTYLIIKHGDGNFLAKGKIIVDQGWSVLYKKNSKDSIIPSVNKGDAITAKTIMPQEKKTSPPKRLTQTTLINAMRNIASQIEDKELKKSLSDSQGIGTPATRASIIKDIIQSGYIDDKKDGLYITQLGKSYVQSLENLQIANPVFAAQLDTELKKVQRGELDFDDVMGRIIAELNNMCKQIGLMEQQSYQTEMTAVQCPICKSTLAIQKYSYKCSNPECKFKIQKEICGKPIDEKLLQILVSGKTSPMFTLKKKDGSTFKSCLKLDENGGIVFTSGITCPKCGGDARINRGGVFCDCGFKIFRNYRERLFSDDELKQLITKRKIDHIISGLKKKTGEKFSAFVVLKEDFSVYLIFPESKSKRFKK